MNGLGLNRGLKFAALALPALVAFSLQGRADGNDNRAPEVPTAIQVPEGNKVQFHAYAVGVQIYNWNGTAWVFDHPKPRFTRMRVITETASASTTVARPGRATAAAKWLACA